MPIPCQVLSNGWNVVGLTRYVYDLAGANICHPPEPTTLIEGILGPYAVRFVPGRDLGGVEAKLAWAINPRLDWTLPGTGQREVLVRSRLQPVRQFPLMLHELGEWVLVDVERYVGADIERYADALGASFLAPDPAFRLAIEECGDDFEALATCFCGTQAWAALRYAEVTGASLALVTPKQVHRRGELVWPENDEDVRALARAQVKDLPAMLKKTSLTDARRQVVLLVGLLRRLADLAPAGPGL